MQAVATKRSTRRLSALYLIAVALLLALALAAPLLAAGPTDDVNTPAAERADEPGPALR